MYFLGTFDYAMDERGRVPLPPRYRDAFREGILLSQSPDRCLVISTPLSFRPQAEDYTQEPAIHRKGRMLRRFLFGRTYEAELDKQSRFLIPQPLRDYAGLTSKVLLVGTGESIEIWDPDIYAEEMRLEDETIEQMLESVERRER